MDAVLAKESNFLNRWAKAENINARLILALCLVSLLALGLMVAMVFLALRPRPIYVLSPNLETGIAMPTDISDSTIGAFAMSWLLNWSNYTPATIEDIYRRAKRFMSPAFLGKIQVRLDKDLTQVKRDNISALCSIIDDPVLVRNGAQYNVTLTGQSGIYLGKEEIKTQKSRYHMVLRKINPTDINPLGLMIESIEQEIVL